MLRVSEIFYSIQGEAATAGIPTCFIRLTGCPMRCHYCDTQYAFHGGEKLSIQSILTQVAQFKTQYVTVTGGEPLAQRHCYELITSLCDNSYRVSLETGGGLSIQSVDPRVYVVLDIKTPGSGEVKSNQNDNFHYLKSMDTLKFVICHRADYEWSVQFIEEHQLWHTCELLFSPEANNMSPTKLAEWILEDGLGVRMQVQLHKILWGNRAGH